MSISAISVCRRRPVAGDTRASVIYDSFADEPDLCCVAIVDPDFRPVGIINRIEYLQRMAHPFGHALFDRKPVVSIMDADPLIVSVADDLDMVMKAIATGRGAESLTGFIVVAEDGRYYGTADGVDVIRAGMEAKAKLAERLEQQADYLNTLNTQLAREVREREAAEQTARRLADIDPLTELANRRRFLGEFEDAMNNGERTAVIFVDLDRFKAINDRYSHLIGDQVLKIIGGRIRAVAAQGLAARLGGDEFGILSKWWSDRSELDAFCRVLRQAVAAPCDVEGHTLNVGASIGVARFPSDAADGSSVLLAADLAMLRAKREGGGHRFFDPRIDTGQNADNGVRFRETA